ncbi:hypothetical protein ACK2F5_18555 [Clostridioides difficile]
MKRAYYSSSVNEFIVKDIFTIFGEITCNDQFAADDLQKNTWKKEIGILKESSQLSKMDTYYLSIQYHE